MAESRTDARLPVLASKLDRAAAELHAQHDHAGSVIQILTDQCGVGRCPGEEQRGRDMRKYLLAGCAATWILGVSSPAPAGSFDAQGQFVGAVSPQITALLRVF